MPDIGFPAFKCQMTNGNNNKNLNTKTTKKFFCHSEKLFQFIFSDSKDLLQLKYRTDLLLLVDSKPVKLEVRNTAILSLTKYLSGHSLSLPSEI